MTLAPTPVLMGTMVTPSRTPVSFVIALCAKIAKIPQLSALLAMQVSSWWVTPARAVALPRPPSSRVQLAHLAVPIASIVKAPPLIARLAKPIEI